MQLNDKDIKNIIEEVVKRYLSSSENSEIKDTPVNTARAEERVGNKLELIEEVYSTESLKNTEYYGKLVKNIYALKNYIVEYDNVKRIFRNIASKDVIPKIIYQENEEEIVKNIEILKKKAKGLDEEERKDLRSEKIEARREINQFKVAIPEYEFDNISLEKVKKIEINDYETLIILDCDYSYDKGAEVLKEERNKDSEDSFF